MRAQIIRVEGNSMNIGSVLEILGLLPYTCSAIREYSCILILNWEALLDMLLLMEETIQ